MYRMRFFVFFEHALMYKCREVFPSDFLPILPSCQAKERRMVKWCHENHYLQ